MDFREIDGSSLLAHKPAVDTLVHEELSTKKNDRYSLKPNFLSIYIHWPFCETKCPYCDFFSEAKKADEDNIINNYLEDLSFYYKLTQDRKIRSIFFGGGTPSLLKPQSIERLLNHIHKLWPVEPNIEISLEANPNSLKAEELKSAGINRLSLGVQALNDIDLNFLGRIHNTTEALQAIEAVLKNFNNHSMDLIYARPNQKLKNWQEELKQAADFGFKHLSLYQLTIEEGTPFYKNGINNMEEEKSLKLFNFTEDFLSRNGYPKYEVSNFAKKGFESKHNLCYWRGFDYLGIGQSAHGRLSINTGPASKFDFRETDGSSFTEHKPAVDTLVHEELSTGMKDRCSIKSQFRSRSFATTHRCQLEELTPTERATELLLMGLRIVEGINKENFKFQCGLNLTNFINKKSLEYLKAEGLVEETKTFLRATPKGFPVLNKIIESLI